MASTTPTLLKELPRTVIGPLTTTFTPPSACSTAILDCPKCNVAHLGRECIATGIGGTNNIMIDATTCWPPASHNAPIPSTLSAWGFYSPACVCPLGYISACTAIAGSHSDWYVQFLMTKHETAVGCCPGGFTCTNENGQYCSRTASQGQHFPLSECFWDRNAFASFKVPAVFTLTASNSTPTATTVIDGYYQAASMIEIRWQQSDLPKGHATPAEVVPTATARGPKPTAQILHSGVEDGKDGDLGGMSSVAKPAVGVGAALVVVAAIIGGVWFFRKRRRSSKVIAERCSKSIWVAPYSRGVARERGPAINQCRVELEASPKREPVYELEASVGSDRD